MEREHIMTNCEYFFWNISLNFEELKNTQVSGQFQPNNSLYSHCWYGNIIYYLVICFEHCWIELHWPVLPLFLGVFDRKRNASFWLKGWTINWIHEGSKKTRKNFLKDRLKLLGAWKKFQFTGNTHKKSALTYKFLLIVMLFIKKISKLFWYFPPAINTK